MVQKIRLRFVETLHSSNSVNTSQICASLYCSSVVALCIVVAYVVTVREIIKTPLTPYRRFENNAG